MGYLGATLTQVFTCAYGVDVSLRDVTIAQIRNGARECRWRHAPEAHGRFWGFWKIQLSLPWEKTVGFRLLAEARPVALWQVPHMLWGSEGKARIERMCISLPYVEEPLNSNVIKSFVPELRICKCFSCFEIPMFYLYMSWTYYVRFKHISIWQW